MGIISPAPSEAKFRQSKAKLSFSGKNHFYPDSLSQPKLFRIQKARSMKNLLRLFRDLPWGSPLNESLYIGTSRPIKPLSLQYYRCQAELSINRGWFVFDKIAFLMVPKCACTSIKMAFASRLRPDMFGNPSNALSVHGLDAPHGGRFIRWEQRSSIRAELQKSFCVLRDPVARFESFYRDKILGARLANAPALHSDIARAGFDPRMSLAECVKHLVAIPPRLWDQHIVPQYLFLHRAAGSKLVPMARFVLKFESLGEEWGWLSSLVPDLPALPGSRFNMAGAQKQEAMDQDSLAKLHDFYRGDFDILSQFDG